jgi:hypothetical protein
MGLSEASFKLWEARWQQMMRVSNEGQTWDEPPVTASTGNATYPYPGRQGWKEWKALGRFNLTNFDLSLGHAADRDSQKSQGGEPLTPSALDSDYKIVKQ